MSANSPGVLYVVATPIGNREDLSPRAQHTLSDVDLIAAEDTRHTGRLLFAFGCKTPLIALHDHNESEVVERLIVRLKSGDSVALVSDAGTPLLSDPGFRLVRAAHLSNITVSPIPGPSAITAALSSAGLATDRFCFEGFLPAKKAARRQRLTELAAESRTLLFFESVHRIKACLTDMVDVFGNGRAAFLGRELTKIHEQCVQNSLHELLDQLNDGSIAEKGEYVVVVAGREKTSDPVVEVDPLLIEFAKLLPAKEAARVVSRLSGHKKNVLYERLLELKRDHRE